MNYAIILAAGSGKRMGTHIPKQFLDLAGRPVLAWTLTAFERADRIDRVVLVVGREDIDTCREQFGKKKFSKVVNVVAGGAERQDSVACGLQAIPQDTDVVAIHDGARAYVTPAEINAVVLAATEQRRRCFGHTSNRYDKTRTERSSRKNPGQIDIASRANASSISAQCDLPRPSCRARIGISGHR